MPLHFRARARVKLKLTNVGVLPEPSHSRALPYSPKSQRRTVPPAPSRFQRGPTSIRHGWVGYQYRQPGGCRRLVLGIAPTQAAAAADWCVRAPSRTPLPLRPSSDMRQGIKYRSKPNTAALKHPLFPRFTNRLQQDREGPARTACRQAVQSLQNLMVEFAPPSNASRAINAERWSILPSSFRMMCGERGTFWYPERHILVSKEAHFSTDERFQREMQVLDYAKLEGCRKAIRRGSKW
jgi:hypothetical protein